MARLKVGLYNPHITSFGGGEKDTCVMAEALADKYDVDIVTNFAVDKARLESVFNVDLSGVRIRVMKPYVNRYKIKFLGKLYFKALSSRYDIFHNMVVGPPYPNFARRGILRVQFPFSLEAPQKRVMEGYQFVTVYSEYSRQWLKRRWSLDSEIIHPPVEIFSPGEKKNIILSVGRFFVGGHNKKHLHTMCAFKNLVNSGLTGWEYHLMGSLQPGKVHLSYLESVKDFAKGYPLFVHENVPFEILKAAYASCRIFIHAAGYQEDPEKCPERFEHFGLTTVEAMSAGAVPVVIDAGGQKELVRDGVDGYLWSHEKILARRLTELTSDDNLREKLAAEAVESSRNYSRESFVTKVRELFERASAGL